MEEKTLEHLKQYHAQGLTFKQVVNLSGIPRTSLTTLENKLGIKFSRERETSPLSSKEHMLSVIHMDITLAVQLYGRKKVEYWEKAHELKFKRLTLEEKAQTYEHYFDSIDTPEKAYILGLIWTDGCVHEKKEGGAIVRIGLSTQDSKLLYDIRDLVGGGSITDKAVDNTTQLTFYSTYMARTLQKYGCTPAKSLTVGFPIGLLPDYYADFLLGCFDGDGGVYKDAIQFVSGSELFFNSVLDILKSKTSREVLRSVVETKNRKNPLYRLYLNGKDLEAINFIYNESSTVIRVERKQKAFDMYWKNKTSNR